MTSNFEKSVTELPILRAFIDFLNAQLGVYIDCLSSFQGNRARIERQVMRVSRRSAAPLEPGRPVVWTSFEDPSQPDVIHHKVWRSDEYLRANSEEGFNHQQIVWALIVFIYAYWNEDVRPKIARARQVPPESILIDAFGDLRLLRNAIAHDAGIITPATHKRLKLMGDLCPSGRKLSLAHDHVHLLFVHLKRAIAGLLLTFTKELPGAPDISEITGIAIQGSLSWPDDERRR